MSDLSAAISRLVPAAKYSGSATGWSKEKYDRLRWQDERPKPEWADIAAAGEAVEADETKARIAAKRYEKETAGITFNGISLDTTRQSQALITGAALSATRNSDYTVRWKTQDGPVTLDADALGAAADAVRDHVQACFDRELDLLDALADGSFTENMLDEGWPE